MRHGRRISIMRCSRSSMALSRRTPRKPAAVQRKCIGTRRDVVSGNPDPQHVSTSYVERQNLTIRMSNRRFTRLTNASSKKLANHQHMLPIFFGVLQFRENPSDAQGDTRDGVGLERPSLNPRRDCQTCRMKTAHYPFPALGGPDSDSIQRFHVLDSHGRSHKVRFGSGARSCGVRRATGA